MATKMSKIPQQPDYECELTIGGKVYNGVGYESAYFEDGVCPNPNEYYVRHADDDWSRPASIKRNKGLTVNFWGTICTSEPIEFGEADEVEIEVCEMEEI